MLPLLLAGTGGGGGCGGGWLPNRLIQPPPVILLRGLPPLRAGGRAAGAGGGGSSTVVLPVPPRPSAEPSELRMRRDVIVQCGSSGGFRALPLPQSAALHSLPQHDKRLGDETLFDHQTLISSPCVGSTPRATSV